MKVLKWITYFWIFAMNVFIVALMQTPGTPALLAYLFGVMWTCIWIGVINMINTFKE